MSNALDIPHEDLVWLLGVLEKRRHEKRVKAAKARKKGNHPQLCVRLDQDAIRCESVMEKIEGIMALEAVVQQTQARQIPELSGAPMLPDFYQRRPFT